MGTPTSHCPFPMEHAGQGQGRAARVDTCPLDLLATRSNSPLICGPRWLCEMRMRATPGIWARIYKHGSARMEGFEKTPPSPDPPKHPTLTSSPLFPRKRRKKKLKENQ